MDVTPTQHALAFRQADFTHLAAVLDYAAGGETGCNFYTDSGKLEFVLPYHELRQQAQALAPKLFGLHPERQARVAIVAETHPDFHRVFFASQYAGLVPCALPALIQLGGIDAYVTQLRALLKTSGAKIAIASERYLPLLQRASEDLDMAFVGTTDACLALEDGAGELTPLQPDELAYLQFTSGSTQFPRGVTITQSQITHNLRCLCSEHCADMQSDDRCVSWLPFYHDMGLVGLVLVPISNQISVDYLPPQDFAKRPRRWLRILSENQGTISFSPPFGYELCVRHLREGEAGRYDLSHWRIAGCGAELIRPQLLAKFSKILEPANFNPASFVAAYGLAECGLGVSFAPLNVGVETESVSASILADSHQARLIDGPTDTDEIKLFVKCGHPLPDFEVKVCDEAGNSLPARQCGHLYLRSPSVMQGYFNDPEATACVLSADGWLNTGDIGYLTEDNIIVVTGRHKDMMIINGRNIWPQDLEYLAEQQPEIKLGNASAFSITSKSGSEQVVLLVQTREPDKTKRATLAKRLQDQIHAAHGIQCLVDLVPPRTLCRTTSGKLSRSATRNVYLKRQA